jgi:hypothetical protein
MNTQLSSVGDHQDPAPRFTTDIFTQLLCHDNESHRYRILHELQRVRREFSHSRIYPYLSDLITTHTQLAHILQAASGLKEHFPRTLIGLNTISKQPEYAQTHTDNLPHGLPDQVLELIAWAMPHIEEVIEEGKEIFEFVEASMNVEVIGVLPTYMQAGYFAMPDNKYACLHIVRFEVALYESSNERYRSIKTSIVETTDIRFILPSAHSLKLNMIEQFPDMPNPAFFNIATDIDFSYQHTMYPIAKRKMMHILFSV